MVYQREQNYAPDFADPAPTYFSYVCRIRIRTLTLKIDRTYRTDFWKVLEPKNGSRRTAHCFLV